MNHFSKLAAELLADYGSRIDLDRLNEVDKRRLCAAYLRDDPRCMEFVETYRTRIPEYLAALIEPSNDFDALDTDWTDLLLALRRVSYPNAELERLVQAELDYLYSMRMAS